MTTYKAIRKDGDVELTADGAAIDTGHDYVNHTTHGVNFGYGGSGPAQAAFAILLHHFRNADEAFKHYQNFKWEHIATAKGDVLTITSAEIKLFIEDAGRKKEA